MKAGVSIFSFSCLLLGACTGDSDNNTTTFTTTTSATQTASASDTAGTDSSTTDATTSDGTGTSSTTDATTTDATTTDATTSGSGSSGGSTTGDACGGKVVPGEWNSCFDENGNVDNTLCKWMGTGDSKGIVGCLTSSENADANTCFINGCETVCDCFQPPATGDATVICDEILDGGGKGCALSCANGETCPDGMECLGQICFWPPA